MKTAALVLLACLLVTGVAFAQKGPGNSSGVGPDRDACLTAGYEAYLGGPGGPVPDGDPNGATFGPLATVGGNVIEDVIFYVEIYQTWIGDLRVWLLYDADCDGTPETQGEVLCRHTLDLCDPDGCCGCSGDLGGWYGFDDTEASIEDMCPSLFDPGCYGPDYDSVGLDVFNGLATGGCFYAFVADGAGGDAPTFVGWEVYVLTETTPVEDSTWSTLKALYR